MAGELRTNLPDAMPTGASGQESFLSRWSRRKRGQDVAPPEAAAVGEPEAAAVAEGGVDPAETADPIDPRTGKRYSELTDEDMPAVESLDANSDLSVFMAGKVSSALRMRALTKVFHTAKFNQFCVCAEYAEDYTGFAPLGDIVPHDLKQAIAREAGKLYQRLTEKGLTISREEVEARVAAEFRGERLEDPDKQFAARQVSGEVACGAGGETLAAAERQGTGEVPPDDQEVT